MLESNFDMKNIKVTDVIESILEKFKWLGFNIYQTPMNVSFVLQKNEQKSDSKLDYATCLRSIDIYHEVYSIRYSMCYQ